MGNSLKHLEDHEGFASAIQKLNALCEEQRTVARQITDTIAALRTPGASIQSEAIALLAGASVDQIDRASLQNALGALQHRQNVLSAAAELQRREIERQRELASREICTSLAPEWLAMVKEIAGHVGKLLPVLRKEHSFRIDLERSGVYLCPPISHDAGVADFDATSWKLENLVRDIQKIQA